MRHNYTGYANGCRCSTCVEAGAEYRRKRRAIYKNGEEELVHGTTHAYNVGGCRCEPCKAASNRYSVPAYRKRKQYLNELKSRPCMDCGTTYPPECMDFDHVRGDKRKAISAMLSSNQEVLDAEINKCELVCSNCHRIRTEQRRAPSVRKG